MFTGTRFGMTNQVRKAVDTIAELYELLGRPSVLLPIRKGKKGPNFKGWNGMTCDKSQSVDYQKRLRSHANTGVLLGEASGGLCSVDLDDDLSLERFLKSNSLLRRSLITKGKRGGNVWIRLKGPIPRTQKLSWGEWRADGAQTVIRGFHPEGMEYRFLSKGKPVELRFSGIKFPFENAPNLTQRNATLEVPHNIGCYAIEPKEERTKGERFEEELYEKLVGRHLKPNPNSRNANLVKSLSFLFYQVSPSAALSMGMMIYDKHANVWKDTRDRHEYECRHLIDSMTLEYTDRQLSGKSKELYLSLSEKERVAFRICRSLAKPSGRRGNSKFFLSSPELAKRIGIANRMGEADRKAAYRILQKLRSKGVIREGKKGNRKSANEYRWILKVTGNSESKPVFSEKAKNRFCYLLVEPTPKRSSGIVLLPEFEIGVA